MQIKTITILGGGPAGCALAYYLSQKNIKSIIYEARSVVGGMARSWVWNNFIVDTGPHILHTDNKEIETLWKSLLSSDLVEDDFYAANYKSINDRPYFFDYPLNVEQLKETDAWDREVTKASLIKLQDLNPTYALANSSSFSAYFKHLVGDHLEQIFFRDYPEKVWGIPTSEIIPDWAPKRIRVTNSREPFYTNEFASVSSRGTGYLFEQLIASIPKHLISIKQNCKVTSINTINNYIYSVNILENDELGEKKIEPTNLVVSTLPVSVTTKLLGKSYDLSFRGILSLYTSFSKGLSGKILPQPYNWTYIADKNILPNRITEPTSMAPKLDLYSSSRPYLISEICCNQATDAQEIEKIVTKGIDDINLLPFIKSGISDYSFNWEPYVYPVQSHKNIFLSTEAFSFLSTAAKNLLSLGTSSNFAYNDIQVIFQKASEMAEDIVNIKEFNISNVFYATNLVKTNLGDEQRAPSYSIDQIKSPLIIAEIGINHNGNKEHFYRLCEEAALSGSSFVKFQYYNAKYRIGQIRELEHIEKSQDIEENIQDMLGRCELSLSDICEAKGIVESNGATPMCTAFSLCEMKELLSVGFSAIKISSMDMNNVYMHKFVSSYNDATLQVFISTGMSDLNEIDMLYEIYKGSHHKICLLYCVSSYPTPFDEVHLSCIKEFAIRYPNFKIGYSDHTISNSAATSSIFYGAQYVEVHFTDNKNKSGPDQILSKTSDEIKQLINFYDEIKRMSVIQSKSYQSAEFKTWKTQKKALYASKTIEIGDPIDDMNTYLSSPPTDFSPLILAKSTVRATQVIKPGLPIYMSSVKF